MRHLAILAVLSLTLAASATAEAANAHKAAEKAAKKACAAGDFRKGVETLAELYVETNEPTYLFNQGRCYEQNHQWVNAIDRFREYLRKVDGAPASAKADAEKHIADCESFRMEEESKVAPPPVATLPPPAPVAPPPPLPPLPPQTEAVDLGRPVPRAEPRDSGLRLAGVVIGSVGLATAVTGLVLNLKANALADDFNKTRDPATKSSRSSYRNGAIVCYGAGAGALVTGVVLYLIGRSDSSGATQVSFSPVWTMSEFSVVARKTF